MCKFDYDSSPHPSQFTPQFSKMCRVIWEFWAKQSKQIRKVLDEEMWIKVYIQTFKKHFYGLKEERFQKEPAFDNSYKPRILRLMELLLNLLQDLHLNRRTLILVLN